jgi:hypothetical protein
MSATVSNSANVRIQPVSANCPSPCPVRIRAGFTLASRESPFDCMARCASSRSFRHNAWRLPPMTMLASPEDRRAIKDSRGKCRSRVVAALRTFPGQFKYRDTVGSQQERGRGHLRGLSMANLRTRQRSWSRIGHGLTVAADMRAALARTDCGFSATISRTQNPRFAEG